MRGDRQSDITLDVARLPKRDDIVLTTHRFPDNELVVCRVLVIDNVNLDVPATFPSDDIVYAVDVPSLKAEHYGISWVFEDDVEGAEAFRVSVALL